MADKNKELDEIINQIGSEMPFKEQTEIGQVFENLDKDEQDTDSKMSNIDFNANLTPRDIKNCIIVDEFLAMGILPVGARITRQKKRLSRAEGALGSRQKVEIASAQRGADLSGRSGGMLSKMFSPRE